MIVGAGVFFTVIFQIFTPEGKSNPSYSKDHDETQGLLTKDKCDNKAIQEYTTGETKESFIEEDMKWRDWLTEFQFYQVGIFNSAGQITNYKLQRHAEIESSGGPYSPNWTLSIITSIKTDQPKCCAPYFTRLHLIGSLQIE